MKRRIFAASAALVAGGVLTLATAASAGAQTTASGFTCSATGLRILTTQYGVAGAPGSPCVDRTDSPADRTLVAPLPIPLVVRVAAVSATTANTDFVGQQIANGYAQLAAVQLQLGTLTIQARGLAAEASARCRGIDGKNVAVLSDDGQVADVTINGKTTVIDNKPTDIPLGPLGVLHLNSETRTDSLVTRRALWLHSILGDVVVGEGTAGTYGNPCPQP